LRNIKKGLAKNVITALHSIVIFSNKALLFLRHETIPWSDAAPHPDPDPVCHFDADPDPDPSFEIKAQKP
jgi:hypothetical protein